MRGHDIGKGLSIFETFARYCNQEDEYGSAMGAPMDELGPIIRRGHARTMRLVRRRIKAATGLKFRIFAREVVRRTSSRWTHFHTNLGFEESLQRRHG